MEQGCDGFSQIKNNNIRVDPSHPCIRVLKKYFQEDPNLKVMLAVF